MSLRILKILFKCLYAGEDWVQISTTKLLI